MIKRLPKMVAPSWLNRATAESMQRDPFPLNEILKDSLYYPASGFDGDPIRHLAGNILSFVYVDYGRSPEDLDRALATPGISGYRQVGVRSVSKSELTPNGWDSTLVLYEHDGHPRNGTDLAIAPFCNWFIFERLPERNDSHGPARFSLLYLCADGVAAYQALYPSNRATAKAIAIIQPGEAFGGNWTAFGASDQILARLVMGNPAGHPEWLLFGGYGPWYGEDGRYSEQGRYKVPCWPQYSENLGYVMKMEKCNFGTIGIWRKPALVNALA